ncbi:hypothetical protein GCM10027064_25720 [Microbacterium petrolearium]
MDESAGEAARARLVLFRAGDPHYAPRVARRRRVMSMAPVDPTEAETAERARRSLSLPAGVHWEYLQADDIPLMLRSRDLRDADDARWDAERVFEDALRLRVVFVQDRLTRQVSWWLASGREVLLVAPTAWAVTNRAGAAAHARRALRALRAQPPWGEYAF